MSHFYPDIHLARVDMICKRLKHETLTAGVPLEVTVAVTPEPVPWPERTRLEAHPIAEGERWGGTWACGWFHLQGRVPESFRGRRVALHLDFGGEACVYDASGCPAYGLTNGSVFDRAFNKDVYPLFTTANGGEAIDLWVDAGANDLFGVNRCLDPGWVDEKTDPHGTYEGILRHARVCQVDYDKWQLWLDLTVAADLVRALPAGTARRMGLLRAASHAAEVYSTSGAAAAREAAQAIFALAPDPAAPQVTGVGHAHIDVCWLWPLRETRRKCARTFASQIALINRYPDYVFGASQAQLYAFIQAEHPALYAKIKAAIAAGRWEVQGAMWVEADCNLPSGESLVRQVLVGKNFFKDEFGLEVKNLWLPDVFGYSGNLPQILKRAGVDYFLTQKLSWNRYNKFPHNTFRWRGIDGSEVLAHFPPEDAYDSDLTPSLLRRHETNNAEAGLVAEALCLYGIGDGGGGPAENHVERGLRCRHLNGCPPFSFGFAQPILEKMAAYGQALDCWEGELYFETHRGTLTTQAAMKTANRDLEETFKLAETLCTLAYAQGAAYPRERFLALWKRFLINQFHDILPGSCIHRVYAEQLAEMKAVRKAVMALAQAAVEKLTVQDLHRAVYFNPSDTTFRGRVAAPGTPELALRERPAPANTIYLEVPPHAFVTMRATGSADVQAETLGDTQPLVLENRWARCEFNPLDLTLTRFYDKVAQRELVPTDHPGNALGLFDDFPPRWDAWDLEEYTCDQLVERPQVVPGSLRRITGPAGTAIEARLRCGESEIAERLWLDADNSPRLDFEATVEWREDHKCLRVAFPTTIKADVASSEIQYGTVKRPTHSNTKWQHAQFECVAHRFCDLSEHDYGVALLNDCKYGYRAKDGELSLTLLRSPTEPDPVADRGRHHFTYSLLPHAGDLEHSQVLAHAAMLNQGVARFDGRSATTVPLPFELAGEVEIGALKQAEKENAIIIRLVERHGRTAKVQLKSHFGSQRIVETDLMEWHELGEIAPGDTLTFTPFAIRTFKLEI